MDGEPEAVALANELQIQQSSARVFVVRPLTERPVTTMIDDRNAAAPSDV
jgi:hypothetical protein